jgi:hypothetical protein
VGRTLEKRLRKSNLLPRRTELNQTARKNKRQRLQNLTHRFRQQRRTNQLKDTVTDFKGKIKKKNPFMSQKTRKKLARLFLIKLIKDNNIFHSDNSNQGSQLIDKLEQQRRYSATSAKELNNDQFKILHLLPDDSYLYKLLTKYKEYLEKYERFQDNKDEYLIDYNKLKKAITEGIIALQLETDLGNLYEVFNSKLRQYRNILEVNSDDVSKIVKNIKKHMKKLERKERNGEIENKYHIEKNKIDKTFNHESAKETFEKIIVRFIKNIDKKNVEVFQIKEALQYYKSYDINEIAREVLDKKDVGLEHIQFAKYKIILLNNLMLLIQKKINELNTRHYGKANGSSINQELIFLTNEFKEIFKEHQIKQDESIRSLDAKEQSFYPNNGINNPLHAAVSNSSPAPRRKEEGLAREAADNAELGAGARRVDGAASGSNTNGTINPLQAAAISNSSATLRQKQEKLAREAAAKARAAGDAGRVEGAANSSKAANKRAAAVEVKNLLNLQEYEKLERANTRAANTTVAPVSKLNVERKAASNAISRMNFM